LLFNKKLYQQAAKCFSYAKNEIWASRCQALGYANEGNELWIVSKAEPTKKAEVLKQKGIELLIKAAKIFKELNMRMEAAQCYYTLEMYRKAAECFKWESQRIIQIIDCDEEDILEKIAEDTIRRVINEVKQGNIIEDEDEDDYFKELNKRYNMINEPVKDIDELRKEIDRCKALNIPVDPLKKAKLNKAMMLLNLEGKCYLKLKDYEAAKVLFLKLKNHNIYARLLYEQKEYHKCI